MARTATEPKKKSVYSVHSGVLMTQKWITELKQKTGKSLDMKPAGRLIDTGGFAKKDRITHRIPITSLDDIDDEVKHWLKIAYDRDA
jgi:hypothetical protein